MKPKYITLILLYGAGLFYLMASPRPVEELPDIPGITQIGHFVLFAGMAGVVTLGMARSDPGTDRQLLFWAPLAGVTLYGLFLEGVQLFVPGRSFEWTDILVNFLGALAMQGFLCRRVWPAPAGNPGGRRGI
jgi:VanZ family protein